MKTRLALVAALVSASPAAAHVTVAPKAAPAGAYQLLRFGLGHGCGEAPTTALRIETPAGLTTARPQPKPGWTLTIDKAADGAVRAVTWRGVLPADQYEEFLLLVKLPARAGLAAFPAVQSCGATEVRWDEIPIDGARAGRPAPAVQIEGEAAPAAHGEHKH